VSRIYQEEADKYQELGVREYLRPLTAVFSSHASRNNIVACLNGKEVHVIVLHIKT
jgi:hypothetical protein